MEEAADIAEGHHGTSGGNETRDVTENSMRIQELKEEIEHQTQMGMSEQRAKQLTASHIAALDKVGLARISSPFHQHPLWPQDTGHTESRTCVLWSIQLRTPSINIQKYNTCKVCLQHDDSVLVSAIVTTALRAHPKHHQGGKVSMKSHIKESSSKSLDRCIASIEGKTLSEVFERFGLSSSD
ncbi:hypothetical protein PSHT_11427, partial [Puccinia striiformis]